MMRRATGVQEEWSSRLRFLPQAIQNPAYRLADTRKGARRKTAGPPPIWLLICSKTNSFEKIDIPKHMR